MHILFNPRLGGIQELLFTHVQTSGSGEVRRCGRAAELKGLLSECWEHKSNTFNLKTMLGDHGGNLQREKSTKKDTERQGEGQVAETALYSWDDCGGGVDVPCLPDFRS